MKTKLQKKFCCILFTTSLLFLFNFPVLKAQWPVADFTFSVHANGSVDFTSTSTNTASMIHKWYFGDGSSTFSVQSTSHTYTANGSYAVLLVLSTANDYIYDSVYKSVFVNSITTGITGHNLCDASLIVYPNPANGILNITIGLPGNNLLTAKITDVQGKEVESLPCTTIQDLKWNTGSYSEGVYILELVSDKSVINRKIVVRRE